MLPIALAAREHQLPCLVKTNGFLHPSSLAFWAGILDAANIDLKAFRESTYRQLGGHLGPVLDAMEGLRERGVWVEISTLVINGINDTDQELADLADHLVARLGPETPWHLLRFFPIGDLADRSPTPLSTLQRAREIGLAAGLQYVYFGNIKSSEEQSTYCPSCSRMVIKRSGDCVLHNAIVDDHCPDCGTLIPGYGMSVRPSGPTPHMTAEEIRCG